MPSLTIEPIIYIKLLLLQFCRAGWCWRCQEPFNVYTFLH